MLRSVCNPYHYMPNIFRVQTEGWEAWTRLKYKDETNSPDLVWNGIGEKSSDALSLVDLSSYYKYVSAKTTCYKLKQQAICNVVNMHALQRISTIS